MQLIYDCDCHDFVSLVRFSKPLHAERVLGFWEEEGGRGGMRSAGCICVAGVGKGLVGVITRPASGVVDFASISFEGIRR